MVMNVKNHHIFSDKLKLCVVDLSNIELATEEDKVYGIDHWARLFKAKTWEEMKELAEKNTFFQEAAESLYAANADELVRQKCLARRRVEKHENTIKRDMKKLKDELVNLKSEYVELKDENVELKDTINKVNRLTRLLLEQNRFEDLARATTDKEYQEYLFIELGID